MNDRALTELRDLARRDAELAGQADGLRSRDRDVAEIRARAEAIDAFFAAYPEHGASRRAAVADAEAAIADRREEFALAQAVLARSREENARAYAQHAVDRARDHIDVAEAGLRRAEGELAALEREAATFPDELTELEQRADADVTGARGLVEWASHTHAELFVAAGQIDAQRERLSREAHELASMLLGEPTFGATIAQALARVEARLPDH